MTTFSPPRLPHRPVQLTARQADILRRLCLGMSNAEIGAALYITENTVKTTVKALYRALGARDRAHAVALAYSLAPIPIRDKTRSEFGTWRAA